MSTRWPLGAAFSGSALSAPQGPCAADPGELARAIIDARPPALAAAHPLFLSAVRALHRGDSREAGRQLGALVRAIPTLALAGGLCALIHAAVRQGTLKRDAHALAGLRTLAQARTSADAGQLAQYALQECYQDCQQAVSTIAAIEKSLHDDAMTAINNVKS